jgi:two-component system, LytTR family, response regulator
MMTCFIIEDNELARLTLRQYIEQSGLLTLAGEFENAMEAYRALQQQIVDVVFLDIGLPDMSGIELLSLLSNRPYIIFTTASREHAADAFDMEAVDYLVKPVSFARFQQAVNRALRLKNAAPPAEKLNGHSTIFVKEGKDLVRVNLASVLYVEALGDYVKIQTDQRWYTVHATMKEMEEKMLPLGFLRVHRSYIVNTRQVNSFKDGVVAVQKHEIPVSDRYKSPLLASMQML